MKILQINATYRIGSTGKIMSDLNNVIEQHGHTGFMMCGYSTIKADNLFVVKDVLKYPLNAYKNVLRMKLSGLNGYSHKRATIEAIEWIKKINPDIIHLHNIHGNWIHLPTLFRYLGTTNKQIVWTLHDCWSFTGRCSHFERSGCEQWKSNCKKCNNKKVYPATCIFDFSKAMHMDKKRWYSNLSNLIIVTPSNWLAKYVRESFLGHYEIVTIHNGIDTKTFCPSKNKSKYFSNTDKMILLGVSSSWSATKGYDDFVKLNSLIDHNKYQIAMVGLNKRQLKTTPKTIIKIGRTSDQNELSELYSSAKVFINPTYQDNYPTTNLEAQSCGTSVITYDTGGSPESIISPGYVVLKGDIVDVYRKIRMICESQSYNRFLLSTTARKSFNKEVCFEKYIELYLSTQSKLV